MKRGLNALQNSHRKKKAILAGFQGVARAKKWGGGIKEKFLASPSTSLKIYY